MIIRYIFSHLRLKYTHFVGSKLKNNNAIAYCLLPIQHSPFTINYSLQLKPNYSYFENIKL